MRSPSAALLRYVRVPDLPRGLLGSRGLIGKQGDAFALCICCVGCLQRDRCQGVQPELNRNETADVARWLPIRKDSSGRGQQQGVTGAMPGVSLGNACQLHTAAWLAEFSQPCSTP